MKYRWSCVVLCLLLAPLAQAQKTEFDHFTTGFILEGAHELTACASCHVKGQFAGTPRQCAACHSNHGVVNATVQPAQHITTTDQCGSCHRSFAWTPVQRVDHLEVFGGCSSCHDGLRAQGQFVGHLPTSQECDTCHRTTTFAFARFSHAGITGGCGSCHNNVQALGKPADHIPSSDQCEGCHGTTAFSPVLRIDPRLRLGSGR